MKQVLTAVILFFSTLSNAQQVVDVSTNQNIGNSFYSVGGQPFVNAKFVRLKSGSPYFSDNWLKGKATGDQGQLYTGAAVKINLLDNQVLFLNANGGEMIANAPMKELTLSDSITKQDFRFVSSTTLPTPTLIKKGWYLQLVAGKASLLQYFNKRMIEDRPYGSATTEQSIITTDEFHLLVNGGLIQVKKPKDLPKILFDKKKELESYLAENDLQNLTIGEQLTSIIKHYNSL